MGWGWGGVGGGVPRINLRKSRRTALSWRFAEPRWKNRLLGTLSEKGPVRPGSQKALPFMNEPATELVIDGATLEGGGQVLRCCLSLAWLQHAPVRIHSIRAGRPKPGLANQHLAGAQLTATLAGFRLEGATKGSTTLVVDRRGSRTLHAGGRRADRRGGDAHPAG